MRSIGGISTFFSSFRSTAFTTLTSKSSKNLVYSKKLLKKTEMAAAQLAFRDLSNFDHSPKKFKENPLVMKFTKVIPTAHPPTKGSVKAAGYDLKSAVTCTVPARGKYLVDTGIKIELPTGCYGRIAPRSGLAVKNFIDVGAGVVDEDYRGVIKVVLFNHSDEPFEVKNGDRIAQLICERIYYPDIEEVENLSDTERGEGGFGSTGTN